MTARAVAGRLGVAQETVLHRLRTLGVDTTKGLDFGNPLLETGF